MDYSKLLTEAQYLRVEEAAREKHEYVAGRMYAMSGVSKAHGRISVNLINLLSPLAKQRGCEVCASEVKLRIASLDCFYYPDVLVTCEPFVPTSQFNSAPSLVVEILSPSTESIDRREKLIAYQSIDSLVEYAIAHQDRACIEVYKRQPEGGWKIKTYENNQSVLFESFSGEPVNIPLASIYDWLDCTGDS